jgi:predicted component of type VI protein secretion system
MIARLRIVHGTLQDKHGHGQRPEVKIRGPRFVIGSAADCSLCCQCATISPYHCEIRIEPQRAVVRTLAGEKGTFVNERRVEHEQVLRAGDHLRIGRLEFEVLLEEPAPAGAPAGVRDAAPNDTFADQLSESLAQADEQERGRRLEHPEWRQLHLAPTAPEAAAAAPPATAERHSEKKGTGAKPAPGKLPPPPPSPEDLAKDSTEAAQIALRRLFSRQTNA